jgi:hypothetical protein
LLKAIAVPRNMRRGNHARKDPAARNTSSGKRKETGERGVAGGHRCAKVHLQLLLHPLKRDGLGPVGGNVDTAALHGRSAALRSAWGAGGTVGKQTIEVLKTKVYVLVAGVAAVVTADIEGAVSADEPGLFGSAHCRNTLAVFAPVASAYEDPVADDARSGDHLRECRIASTSLRVYHRDVSAGAARVRGAQRLTCTSVL